ncbi:UNVERIFIED_CONTAM: Pentatricopeptide repeat-containing protein, mitochondrial [Sesamum radiatum]|uniref:Pentatricopeptide repeat-containing protein, mitochondrial n=1 Tax=Sesamum radiatum TaxID=300843 RepID=A0AAW2W3X1_SESRA
MHLSALRTSLSSKVRKISFSYCSAPFNHYQEQDDRCSLKDQELKENKEPLIGSRARIHKLIASQSDPLLAKEIFDLACRQPNFQHSYATYHSLILKLGRSHNFSLMHAVLSSLKSHNYSISPSLFTHIIEIYGDAKLPEKVLKTFYTILEFNIKPRTKPQLHSQLLLTVTSFSLHSISLGYCKVGRAADACKVLDDMPSNGCLPNLLSYQSIVGGLCNQGDACEVLFELLRHGNSPHADTWAEILPSICEADNTTGDVLQQVIKVEINPNTRIVDVGAGLEDYLIKKIKTRSRRS